MVDFSHVSLRRVGLVAGLAFAALGGSALAAGLPGASSSTADAVLTKLGVNPPGPNSHAGTHPDGSVLDRPKVAVADQPSAEADAGPTDDHGKGAEISQLAKTTTSTGVAKGAEISTLASGGKSTAGQHAKAGEAHGQSGDDHGQSGDDHGQSGESHGRSGSHRP
jgi:hypothetical protein